MFYDFLSRRILTLALCSFESDGADEAEAQEQQRRKQAAQPEGDFNDILQKASQLKAAQLKDKRRAWEATPEFMKNTMVSTL